MADSEHAARVARDAAFARNMRTVGRFFSIVKHDDVAFRVARALSRRAFSAEASAPAYEHVVYALNAISDDGSAERLRVAAQVSKQPNGRVHIAGPCPSPIYGATDALVAIARAAVGDGVTVASVQTGAGQRLVMDADYSCYLNWSVKEATVLAYMHSVRVRTAMARHRDDILGLCEEDGTNCAAAIVDAFLTGDRVPCTWVAGKFSAYRIDPAGGATLAEMGGVALLEEMLERACLGYLPVTVSPLGDAFTLAVDPPANWYDTLRGGEAPAKARRGHKRVSSSRDVAPADDTVVTAAPGPGPAVVDEEDEEPPEPKRRKRRGRHAKRHDAPEVADEDMPTAEPEPVSAPDPDPVEEEDE